MKRPTISELIHHIKLCPEEFLKEPHLHSSGQVHTEALVNDLFRLITDRPVAPKIISFDDLNLTSKVRAHIQIAVWLLSLPFFKTIPLHCIKEFLFTELPKLAAHIKPQQWLEDEERAEELARLALHCCKIIPSDETLEESQDRFEAVNTIKRLQVLEESRASFERAQEIRRKMAEKKAREAANVYARE